MENKLNEVKPFKALHYNPAKVKEIGLCLSQPYDVISPAMQEEYYRQHNYNVVRLILGKSLPGDNEDNNCYTRARAFLNEWLKQGILIQAEHPAFYIYEQAFKEQEGKLRFLRGFIGLVRLSEYSEGKVLPHEQVLSKPVADRIKLTLTTQTQFEYIWGLYQDESGGVERIISQAELKQCILDYHEKITGVRHRLFKLSFEDDCQTIRRILACKKIYIADGHHRYQTMLNIRQEFRERFPSAGPDAPWEYIMMFLVDIAHEDLLILPTHRLLYHLPPERLKGLEPRLKEYFSFEHLAFKTSSELEVRQRLLMRLKQAKQPAFGLILADSQEYLFLELKAKDSYLALFSEKVSDTWKMLDVNVLNFLILKKILGITEEELALQTNLLYCKDEAEAVGRVLQKEVQAAFLLRATPLKDVLTIAEAGEKMPRKSTYFYPKPLSGLVFFPMATQDINLQ